MIRQSSILALRFSSYKKAFLAAKEDPNGYWLNECKNIVWGTPPTLGYQVADSHFYQWFTDGKLNITTNCLDRHLTLHADAPAYLIESPITGQSSTITYAQLTKRVESFADGLKRNFKIKSGDRVVIYMPMVIESLIAMLACARLGAPHVVVFGGFSAHELANRIVDCKPSLLICANAGIEPNKTIDYLKIINESLLISKQTELQRIIFQRSLLPIRPLLPNQHDFVQVENSGSRCSPQIVDSNHPLYILYTSGTTGRPKGIMRDHGGTAVALQHAMRTIYNPAPRDTMFCSSDIGWVLGHSFIVYGPLICAMQSILFEGKPICTPDAGVFWEICERQKVKYLYTSPTAVRSIRKEDSDGKFIDKRDLSHLKNVTLVGERCDIETFKWVDTHLKGKLINDCYWQTETGSPILSNFMGLDTFKQKPGSACKPVPGYVLELFKATGEKCKAGEQGIIYAKEPMPPSFMSSILHGKEVYLQKYFSAIEGYYSTGDAGYFDEDGYFYVMSRIDDVINTAGHRLSTGEMEEIIMKHPKVAEVIVIGLFDQVKGEVPVAFVTLKAGAHDQDGKLEAETVKLVRQFIGPVASFKTCHVVHKLPKTRSGKYLRNIVKKIMNKEQYTIPTTVEDIDSVYEIQNYIKNVTK